MNIILGLNFIFPFSYSLTCVIYHDEKESYKNNLYIIIIMIIIIIIIITIIKKTKLYS